MHDNPRVGITGDFSTADESAASPSQHAESPSEESYRCRVCRTVWTKSQIHPSPYRAGMWTCGNFFCGAFVDKVRR